MTEVPPRPLLKTLYCITRPETCAVRSCRCLAMKLEAVRKHYTLQCSLGFGALTWPEQKNTDTEEVRSSRRRYLSVDVSLMRVSKNERVGF